MMGYTLNANQVLSPAESHPHSAHRVGCGERGLKGPPLQATNSMSYQTAPPRVRKALEMVVLGRL